MTPHPISEPTGQSERPKSQGIAPKWMSLIFVCQMALCAVVMSAVGNYFAAMFAFISATMTIAYESQAESTNNALRLASECNEGWRGALDGYERLLKQAQELAEKDA